MRQSNTDDEYHKLYIAESEALWECSRCGNHDLPALNSVDAVDVFHFDFQQSLPTPKLTVGKQFYLRLMDVIYSASTQITTALMWHEMLARRGCNDVMSCLSQFIFHTPLGRTGARWSIWWADNCPGQNKNNYIMWFFQDLIQCNVYSRIDDKFLIAGHIYGSTDQTFSVIECYTSRIDTVYLPSQWYIRACQQCCYWSEVSAGVWNEAELILWFPPASKKYLHWAKQRWRKESSRLPECCLVQFWKRRERSQQEDGGGWLPNGSLSPLYIQCDWTSVARVLL